MSNTDVRFDYFCLLFTPKAISMLHTIWDVKSIIWDMRERMLYLLKWNTDKNVCIFFTEITFESSLYTLLLYTFRPIMNWKAVTFHTPHKRNRMNYHYTNIRAFQSSLRNNIISESGVFFTFIYLNWYKSYCYIHVYCIQTHHKLKSGDILHTE